MNILIYILAYISNNDIKKRFYKIIIHSNTIAETKTTLLLYAITPCAIIKNKINE